MGWLFIPLLSGLDLRLMPIGNSLIDMYSKCGQIDCARNFFNWMDCRDTVSWNLMLARYATRLSEDNIELFAEMIGNSIKAEKNFEVRISLEKIKEVISI